MRNIIRLSVPVIAATAVLASAGACAAQPAAPVPAGFRPSAVSFSSPSSGVALGGVGCTVFGGCRARLAATSNGGATWTVMHAPAVRLGNGSTPVSQVVFASPRDGWLYDRFASPSIWATHDGGARWRRLSLPGDVEMLATSAGTVYAVVSRPGGDQLYSSPAGSNSWARVGTMTAQDASLAVFGPAAWFGSSPYLWATTDGVHWHRYSFSCPAGVFLQFSGGIAPSSSTHVAFLCTFGEGMYHTVKALLQSVNGGRTEHLTGHAPVSGDVAGFAVPPLRSEVVAIAVETPGGDYVARSSDGGKIWASVPIAGTIGGPGLSCLQFVSQGVGWLVVGDAALGGRLLRTGNAGLTWHAVSF